MNSKFGRSVLVTDFLENSAQQYADKPALIFGKEKLNYRDLDDAAARFATVLLGAGFRRGDRVLIVLENSPTVVIVLFGVLKLGGVFSVLNPGTKTEQLAYIVENCQARALISDYAHIEMIRRVKESSTCLRDVWLCKDASQEKGIFPHPFRSFDDDIIGVSSILLPVPCIDLDLAALIYTSGSTGRPKGVMMTHRNIVSATSSINAYLENGFDDIILDVLPLSFDYGLYQIFLAFQVGATIVLERTFTHPYSVIGRMVDEKVTGLPGVPTLFALLFRLRLENYDFSMLRYVTNTGAALPPSFIGKLQLMFPRAMIFSMYGLTECKRVSYLPPVEISKRPTSVGKAMPNVEVYIVDDKGNRLPPNQEGELVVRGSNVMLGYWGDTEGTAKVLRPGPLSGQLVLYTGDFFRMDDEGFLYFVSRKDDIIKSRGERISPKELEDVLYGLEGVSEAKIIGIPDEILGMAIKAVIVTHNRDLSERDVIQHCQKYLEEFKVPHKVEFVSNLPKTSTGKIK